MSGKLEPAEREAYLKYLEDERKKFIAQFDTNGDGVLDEEERNTARAFYFQKKLEQKAAAQAAAQATGQTVAQTPCKLPKLLRLLLLLPSNAPEDFDKVRQLIQKYLS